MSSTVVAPVESELSLVERIGQIEESLKDLKRAARQELKSRRRRRSKRNADGSAAPKGETPEQLKAWHTEVRAVWDEMRAKDSKTPYKRAVAEASARRKGGAATAAPVAAAPVVEKKAKKTAKAEAAAPAPAATNTVVEAAPKKRLSKKSA